MQTIKSICLCLCLLAIASAFASVPLNIGVARYLVDRIDATIDARLAALQFQSAISVDNLGARAERQIAETRRELRQDLASITVIADQRLRALSMQADNRLASMQSDANIHGIALHDMMERQLGRTVDGWVRMAQPASAVLAQAADAAPLFLDCDHNADCAFNRFQGTSKSVERMAQAWEKASPIIIHTAEKIGANSDRATAASAQIAENFAVASKPLPKWMRVVLSVAPPLAQTGAAAVGAGAAAGMFR